VTAARRPGRPGGEEFHEVSCQKLVFSDETF
jgi:hypothetical protein